jgi:hypothetical protein
MQLRSRVHGQAAGPMSSVHGKGDNQVSILQRKSSSGYIACVTWDSRLSARSLERPVESAVEVTPQALSRGRLWLVAGEEKSSRSPLSEPE